MAPTTILLHGHGCIQTWHPCHPHSLVHGQGTSRLIKCITKKSVIISCVLLTDVYIFSILVKRQHKCKVSNLIQTVHAFLVDANESRVVSFVYLVGPTVQVRSTLILFDIQLVTYFRSQVLSWK